jgi:hypothetical protein
VKEGGWKKKSDKKFFQINIKMLHHIVTIAYGINIFGEDSNISATIGRGLTVTNEVILQAHAMNRRVC